MLLEQVLFYPFSFKTIKTRMPCSINTYAPGGILDIIFGFFLKSKLSQQGNIHLTIQNIIAISVDAKTSGKIYLTKK